MIILATVLVIILLFIKMTRKIRLHKKSINIALVAINKNYKELFIYEKIETRLLQCFMVISSEIFCFVIIYKLIMTYSDKYILIDINIYVKTVMVLISFLIIHYSMGYIMLISSKMHSFLYRNEEESLKFDFLLSYFLTTAYLMALILVPNEIYNNALVGIIGVIICYFLNMKILLNVMKNPENIKFSVSDNSSFARISFAALLISFMIIINLYLLVCIVHILGRGGFSNNPGYFDLFYYTIITFTTIGFGDILPLTIWAKFIAIIISITSVVCLTVFLGSIFSYRER